MCNIVSILLGTLGILATILGIFIGYPSFIEARKREQERLAKKQRNKELKQIVTRLIPGFVLEYIKHSAIHNHNSCIGQVRLIFEYELWFERASERFYGFNIKDHQLSSVTINPFHFNILLDVKKMKSREGPIFLFMSNIIGNNKTNEIWEEAEFLFHNRHENTSPMNEAHSWISNIMRHLYSISNPDRLIEYTDYPLESIRKDILSPLDILAIRELSGKTNLLKKVSNPL